MRFPTIFIIFLLSLMTSAFSAENNPASEAIALVASPIQLEEYTHQDNQKKWVTLEKQTFEYKSSRTNAKSCNCYYFANSFDPKGKWGHMVVYPETFNLKNFPSNGILSYSQGLSILTYEFIPATNTHSAYFIAEKIENNTELQGCSQACIKYFIDEFIAKRTNIKYVFSDLRNPVCVHFFPKYGFQLGMVDEFMNYKFSRPMKVPSFWINKNVNS